MELLIKTLFTQDFFDQLVRKLQHTPMHCSTIQITKQLTCIIIYMKNYSILSC